MQKVQASRNSYSGLARVRSAGEIVVGLDQNNLPFSTAHPEPAGLDFEIAGLLAKELGVRLRSTGLIPRTIPIRRNCHAGFATYFWASRRTTDLNSE